MRIAILIDLLVPGGVQKAAIEEVKHLRTLGHRAKLYCLTRSHYDYQYQDLLQGLSVSYLSDHNPWPFRNARRVPFFSFLTTNHLINPFFTHRYTELTGTNLVIAHGTTTCLTAVSIRKNLGIPFVAFIWDPMEFILHTVYARSPLRRVSSLIDPVIRHLQRHIFKYASVVCTPSAVHRRALKRMYKVDPIVIPPGHDFPPAKGSRKRTYLLGYSRWQKEKHPEFFLRLAKLTKTPILLAGSWTKPEEFQDFKRQAKRQNVKLTVRLAVAHKDIPKLASGAIAWVHPNFEAFGMPGLELASQGVPIIIPKDSGVTELFRDGVHGLFPPRGNFKAMSEAAQKLAADPEMAATMGRAAAAVAKRFTWRYHTVRLERTIKKKRDQKPHLVILHNAFVSTRSIGGGDRIMIEIAKRLKGVRVSAIMPKIGRFHWEGSSVRNVKILQLTETRFDGRTSAAEIFLAYLLRTIQTVRILEFTDLLPVDLIVSATEFTPDIVPAYLYKLHHQKTRWISRIYHLIPPPREREGSFLTNTVSWLLQRLDLLLMRTSDRILVDNKRLKRQLIDIGIPEQTIEIHPGGTDAKRAQTYVPKRGRRFSAVSIGRLTPHKGTFDLVPIWKRVVESLPRATLAIAGDGPPGVKRELESQITGSGLDRNIRLLGFIPHPTERRDPLLDLIKNADLALFPDHEAGFGLVVAESMAAGTPVVAYDLPIFEEIYRSGFATVPLTDTDAFAKEIIRLLKNPQELSKLADLAAKQGRRFDWSVSVDRFSKTIGSLSGAP